MTSDNNHHQQLTLATPDSAPEWFERMAAGERWDADY
jgi:hypothetical protein